MKMKLRSRRIRSIDELLAMEEKLPAVCGTSPSAFAARHGLKLSKPYVTFMRSKKAGGMGVQKVVRLRRKLAAA
jgi:hypothetical protein